MTELSERPELRAKVVLVGTPAVGKAAIVKAVAQSFAPAPVRVGEIGSAKVYRTEFLWPEPLADGRPLRVRLFALSGNPEYHAVAELLLTGASGIVFVASLHRDDAHRTRQAMQAMVYQAGRLGLQLGSMPVAMQYHRKNDEGLVGPKEMETWLGVAPGSVASHLTGRRTGKPLDVAVQGVVSDFLRRQCQAAQAA